MIICHLGIKRDAAINPWVRCAELNAQPSGEAHLSITGFVVGLLQGRAFDGVFTPYLDGDIFVGDQWIGHMMTNETETGIWYTAAIEVVPVAIPSPAGIVVARVK
jgi:hypothetical protein